MKTDIRRQFDILFINIVSHFCLFAGELYTWGKGRYGRLGHGDSDDQPKPKLVEALLGYRVIDVACGMETLLVSLCNYFLGLGFC